jgi:hypothetical protein
MYYSLVLLKTFFCPWYPSRLYVVFPNKKNCGCTVKIVLRTVPGEGLPLRFPSRMFDEHSNRTEDKNLIRFPKPSPSPSQRALSFTHIPRMFWKMSTSVLVRVFFKEAVGEMHNPSTDANTLMRILPLWTKSVLQLHKKNLHALFRISRFFIATVQKIWVTSWGVDSLWYKSAA